MIKILYSKKIGHLLVSGHSEYASKGNDIVCAGISAILYAGINTLSKDSFQITIDDGFAEVKAKDKKISEKDAIVFDVMLNGFKSIQEQHSKNITIKEEE